MISNFARTQTTCHLRTMSKSQSYVCTLIYVYITIRDMQTVVHTRLFTISIPL